MNIPLFEPVFFSRTFHARIMRIWPYLDSNRADRKKLLNPAKRILLLGGRTIRRHRSPVAINRGPGRLAARRSDINHSDEKDRRTGRGAKRRGVRWEGEWQKTRSRVPESTALYTQCREIPELQLFNAWAIPRKELSQCYTVQLQL